MSPASRLTCDMVHGCTARVSMIDEKGYVYCGPHGKQRRDSGIRCRKLTGPELRQLETGKPLATYRRAQ